MLPRLLPLAWTYPVLPTNLWNSGVHEKMVEQRLVPKPKEREYKQQRTSWLLRVLFGMMLRLVVMEPDGKEQ